jgi:hypothetical protein
MSIRRLFSAQELTTAFGFLLRPKDATAAAERWFETIASEDQLDDTGNFLAEEKDWRRSLTAPVNVLVRSNAEQSTPSSGGYEKLRGQTVHERTDFLMHLSGFHLRLVMLVSDEAFERISSFLAYDPLHSEQARAQMQAIVQAMGYPVDSDGSR